MLWSISVGTSRPNSLNLNSDVNPESHNNCSYHFIVKLASLKLNSFKSEVLCPVPSYTWPSPLLRQETGSDDPTHVVESPKHTPTHVPRLTATLAIQICLYYNYLYEGRFLDVTNNHYHGVLWCYISQAKYIICVHKVLVKSTYYTSTMLCKYFNNKYANINKKNLYANYFMFLVNGLIINNFYVDVNDRSKLAIMRNRDPSAISSVVFRMDRNDRVVTLHYAIITRGCPSWPELGFIVWHLVLMIKKVINI